MIDDHDSKKQNFIDVIVILSRTKKHLSHIIFSISYAIISNDSKIFAIHIDIITTRNNFIQSKQMFCFDLITFKTNDLFIHRSKINLLISVTNDSFIDRQKISSITIKFTFNDNNSTSFEQNDFDFIRYTNIFCDVYFFDERTHFLCIDTDFDFFLIFRNCFQKIYSNFVIYTMTTNKRFRYNEIKIESIISNQCVFIFFRLQNQFEKFVIINNEMHIVFELFCDMIVDVTI